VCDSAILGLSRNAGPLAPALPDRLNHPLWRPHPGCRNRAGGGRLPPLGRLPQRCSELAARAQCARIEPRHPAPAALGQVGFGLIIAAPSSHPGEEPLRDPAPRRKVARAFASTGPSLHVSPSARTHGANWAAHRPRPAALDGQGGPAFRHGS